MKNFDCMERTGVYQITCGDCPSSYIGQTGRTFKTRFKEHLPDPKSSLQKSNIAQHLIDYNHSLNPIDNSLKILHYCNKARLLNTLEEYEVYRATKSKIHLLNDKLVFNTNRLFDSLINSPHYTTADSNDDDGGGGGGVQT